MVQLNGSPVDATDSPTAPHTGDNPTQSTLLATAGKAVWNTVATVAYGAGVLTGAALLWGASEVAKRILSKQAASTQEHQ